MSSCSITPEPPAPKFTGTPNSIHVPLYEHESGEADFSTWPQPVQNIMLRELDAWCARHADKEVAAQSYSIDPVRRVCVLEFHVGEKVPA